VHASSLLCRKSWPYPLLGSSELFELEIFDHDAGSLMLRAD